MGVRSYAPVAQSGKSGELISRELSLVRIQPGVPLDTPFLGVYLFHMTDRVELKEGHYSLNRESDGTGDGGTWIEAFDRDNPGDNHEQRVLIKGKSVRCGSFYARSYTAQDWWLTTDIEEFLEITEEQVKFRTASGSVYIVKIF